MINEKFHYGTVYVIDRRKTESEITEDFQKIAEVGMDMVVIWPPVFYWETPGGKEHSFKTGDLIMKLGEKLGVKIIVEIMGQVPQMEYLPDWATKDEFRVYNRGKREQYYNFNHPGVKELMNFHIKQCVEHYKNFPALYGYDIWNETAFESYDKYTVELFRQWLKEKYHENISELNDAWERTYTEWSQVKNENEHWASTKVEVDWHMFRMRNIADLLVEWKAEVRKYDEAHVVIADNVLSMISNHTRDRGTDDWKVAGSVDKYGISFYPKSGGRILDEEGPWLNSETLTEANNASKNKGFWISEMQSRHYSAVFVEDSISKEELRFWCMEGVSHGAQTIIYWKWRPFTKGVQVGGRGLFSLEGKETERSNMVKDIADIINKNSDLFMNSRPYKTPACVLYDPENVEFIKCSFAEIKKYKDSLYNDSIHGLYKTLYENNIPADFIRPEDIKAGGLKNYKVLFMTFQFALDNEVSKKIKEFVAAGGKVVADGKTGVINTWQVANKQLPGGEALNEIFNCHEVDLRGGDSEFQIEKNGDIITSYLEPGVKIKTIYEQQIVDVVNGSKVLARFSDGSPAVIKGKYHSGEAIYITTALWLAYYYKGQKEIVSLLKGIGKYLNLNIIEFEKESLAARLISGKEGNVLFLFNYEDRKITSKVKVCADKKNYKVIDLVSGHDVKSSYEKDRVVINFEIQPKNVLLLHLKEEK
ncbi:MAG: hypothetical protein A3J83_09070 [Elusimicrobia bacterium RIFOXYA2_FULL_40_6]|nr:MAG: hypothetical protein A3J83_09070 [Elusimicrobia bacterium RIFOXYA2_FULL_40_6]